MDRRLITASGILLGIGVLLIVAVGYFTAPELLTTQKLQAQVHQAIPEPSYPAPPDGTTEKHSSTTKICAKLPKIQGFSVTVEDRCFDARIFRMAATGPPSDEKTLWQNKVDAIRIEHEKAVRQETSRISEHHHAELNTYIENMIKISTGIIGFISAVIAVIATLSRQGAANT